MKDYKKMWMILKAALGNGVPETQKPRDKEVLDIMNSIEVDEEKEEKPCQSTQF